jgi:hypothetical protein
LDRLLRLPLNAQSQVPTFLGLTWSSYSIDLTVDKAEDVLLHRRILDQCADPANRPVFHVRFVKVTFSSSSRHSPSFNHLQSSGYRYIILPKPETVCALPP